MYRQAFAILSLSLLPVAVMAQPIDRLKISDNEMTCKQLHGEIAAMDKIMAEAKEAEASGQNTATAGKAGDVAAEVASRTGLFGSFGGLAGHIFGSVASKAAASATEQSGQQTSQQAAERTRQAQARKEHVTGLFLDKGCKSSDLNFEPAASAKKPTQLALATPSAKPAQLSISDLAQQTAASVSLLPAVDTSEYFEGRNGGTFGAKTVETLPKNKRVAIAGFRVVFINFNQIKATSRGTYLPGGIETGTAHSKTEITLRGVDAATMQTITNQSYATFVAQLKESGREIVPEEQIKSFWGQIQAASTPYSKTIDLGYKRIGVAFSAKGIPLWWQSGENWGDTGLFDQTNMRAFATFASEANAIVIAPLIVVDFAQLESSGNRSSLTTRTASTSSQLGLAVTELTSRVVRSEEARQGIVFQGEDGNLRLKQKVATDLPFADMVDSQQSRGGLISLPGVAGSKTVTVTSTAQTTPETYTKASVTALTQATGIFAKLFKEYAPQ